MATSINAKRTFGLRPENEMSFEIGQRVKRKDKDVFYVWSAVFEGKEHLFEVAENIPPAPQPQPAPEPVAAPSAFESPSYEADDEIS